jgi:hypothetical protein
MKIKYHKKWKQLYLKTNQGIRRLGDTLDAWVSGGYGGRITGLDFDNQIVEVIRNHCELISIHLYKERPDSFSQEK